MTKKRRSGFTLIELILVIAILAILAAIAQANFALILENARYKADVQTAKNIISAARMKHLSEALGPKDHISGSDLDSSYFEIDKTTPQSKQIESGSRLVDRTGRYWGTANRNVGKFMLLQFSDGFWDEKYEYAVIWVDRYYRNEHYAGHIVKEGIEEPINAIDIFFGSDTGGFPSFMNVGGYILSEIRISREIDMHYKGLIIFD